MDNRPVLRRRRTPPGPPRTALDTKAMRHILMGFVAGSRWNQREVADYAGVAKQRISDMLDPDCPDPTWEAAFKLLALMEINPAEVMMAPEAASTAA